MQRCRPRPRVPAAILAADVGGYSRLMGEDEAGTLARPRRPDECGSAGMDSDPDYRGPRPLPGLHLHRRRPTATVCAQRAWLDLTLIITIMIVCIKYGYLVGVLAGVVCA